jgi:ribosomal protein S18 acetylase RimI-like enzyme
MTINIRMAEPKDFLIVNPVLDGWWGGRKISEKLPRLFFDHFYETSFIAEDNGHLAGFLIGFLSPAKQNEAYIHFIGVHPDYRKLGLARTLYKRFFDMVQKEGRSIVKAVTSPVNKTSIAYHTKMGFECIPGDKIEDGVPIHTDYDGAGQDHVLFKMDLKKRSDSN